MPQKHLPEILERGEVKRLLDQPNKKSSVGLRDFTILKLTANSGMRVSEITSLRIEHVNFLTGDIRIKDGKGNRDRDITVPEDVLPFLSAWKKRIQNSTYLFPTLAGGKRSTRSIEYMIKKYAKKAGIRKPVTPHSLRHFYATDALRHGMNIELLRMALGHVSIITTQKYITLGHEEMSRAQRAFPVV